MPRFGGVLGAEQTDLELWEQTKHIARSTNGESEKDEIGAVTEQETRRFGSWRQRGVIKEAGRQVGAGTTDEETSENRYVEEALPCYKR